MRAGSSRRDLLSDTMSPRGRRPTPTEVLGARVRARREALGWFQADLAKAARTHNTYISRLESGKVNPSLDVIVEVAFALGLNVATLTADLLPRERRRRRRGNRPGQAGPDADAPAGSPAPGSAAPPAPDEPSASEGLRAVGGMGWTNQVPGDWSPGDGLPRGGYAGGG